MYKNDFRGIKINIKYFFIVFIFLICFLNVSCVFALENETSNLTSSISDEPILTEEINNQPEPTLSNNPQIDTYLNTSDVFKYYSGPESFHAYLLDSNNNPLVNKTVHITINEITYNKTTDINGHVSLSINLNSGNYTIFTFFEGDEYYKSCNITNNVHVNSTIYANDVVMYYNNGTQYISLFFSNNGSPLVNVTVTFNINGMIYYRTTNASGWANLTIRLTSGEYIITGFNPITGEMHSNTITVLPIIIDNHDLIKYYRNNSQYIVRILEPSGIPCGAGEIVTFNINGLLYNCTTNSTGHAQLNINLAPGHYIVTAEYNNYHVSNNITVLSTVIAEDLYLNYNDGSQFQCIVLDALGNPYPGQEVTLNINGVNYNRISDEYGTASLNIRLANGQYTITSSFNGLSISNNIYVGSAPSIKYYSFISNNLTMYYGESTYYTAILVDQNGNHIPNKSILIKVNNSNFPLLSDVNGEVKLLVNWDVGRYDVNLSFKSNHPYDTVENKFNKINIIKGNTSLINNSPLTLNYTIPIKYSVKLINSYNKPISGKNISFELLNNTFYNITNNQGIAYYNFELPVGEYNITTTFESDCNYHSSTMINSLIVRDYVLDSNINKENGFYNSSSINLTISSTINNSYIFYSFDNETWYSEENNISFILPRGLWDLYYYASFNNYNSTLKHSQFYINDKTPLVYTNYITDIYNTPIQVNLSLFDYGNTGVKIYYTLNGLDPKNYGILYNNQSININSTTCLKFYCKNDYGLSSNITSVYYLFGAVVNLNSKKTFTSIQEAIDDNQTQNSDVIRVNPGSYHENIIVNKQVTISGKNTPSIEYNGLYHCFGFYVKSDNVIIEGFVFINEFNAIILDNVSNCIVRNNYFNQTYISILSQNSNNCIITNNLIAHIDEYSGNPENSENKSYGIIILNSTDILIKNNYINLTTLVTYNSLGIFFNHQPSKNIIIYNNTIIGCSQREGINIDGFNFSVFNNTISGFYCGIHCQMVNSQIGYNNVYNNFMGIRFNSINCTFNSNNIWNNTLGIVQNRTINSSFYLNRIVNRYYNYYSSCDDIINLNDNWWGVNNITDRNYIGISSGDNIILESNIVISISTDEYLVRDNTIEKARLHINMNYNNLMQDLSKKGHLPDGIDTFFVIYGLNNQSFSSKLKHGESSILLNLTESYQDNNVFLKVVLDADYKIATLNQLYSINYAIFSSAINNSGNPTFLSDSFVPSNNSNVSWFSVSWSKTGIYSSVINIIINGEIINSLNITNKYYLQYKNVYNNKVFEAMLMFNNIFASTKEGVFSPNYYLYQLKQKNLINNLDNTNITKLEVLDNFIVTEYQLKDDEKEFILENHMKFIDFIVISIDYGAGKTKTITFNNTDLKFPSGVINRISNLYYTNIEDENGTSIGYEGMRSFALTTSKVTQEDLFYWLNMSNNYSPGLMKAAYGTFLTDLIILYELDYIADLAAETFNVTWYRSSPAAFSLCNDFNCLYVTGESDHGMGMTVIGNESDVWKFHFTCSFAFSLIEQLVGSNIWNDSTIGSVTLGLLESYLNNESLELVYENGYCFLKVLGDDTSLLVLDLETGIVRDIFSFNGLLGTMPCYHDEITNNAIMYAQGNITEDIVSICNSSIKISELAARLLMPLAPLLEQIEELVEEKLEYLDEIIRDDYVTELVKSIVIGFFSSEMVSIATILLFYAIILGEYEYFIPIIILEAFGGLGLWYSNGCFNENATWSNYGFFLLDTLLAIVPYFGGEFKIGTGFLKVAGEEIIIHSDEYLIERFSIKVIENINYYSPFKFIIKNKYDKPIIEHIESFISLNLLPIPFKELFNNYTSN